MTSYAVLLTPDAAKDVRALGTLLRSRILSKLGISDGIGNPQS